MSLMRTLARVAMGVAVAKGVKSVTQSGRAGRSGTMLDDMLGNKGRSGGSSAGGLGGLLDGLSGRQATQRRSGTSGGLGGLLGGLGGAAGAGGIGALIGGLTGNNGNNGAVNRGTSGFGNALQTQFGDQRNAAPPPTPEQEGLAAVMLMAMVQAAQADGHMDDAERARITDHLDEATAEERAFVEDAMTRKMSVSDLAATVPAGAEAQVYTMSLMAIDFDHPAEVDFLRSFAEELGLEKNDVNDIHAQAGAHPLYG